MKLLLIAIICRLAPLWLLAIGCAHADVVYNVGFFYDPDCDYSDLRSALMAAAANPNGPIEIRDSNTPDASLGDSYIDPNGYVYIGNPKSDITIIGGFSSCAATAPDPGHYTELVYNAPVHDANYRLLSVNNDNTQPRRKITVRNLKFKGAHDPSLTGANAGGGIFVENNVQFTLDHSSISGFSSGNGAGDPFGEGGGIFIYANGTDPAKYPELDVINGSDIFDNTATFGGGIKSDHGRVVMDASSVDNNQAWKNGGGIWLADEQNTGSAAAPTNVALTLRNGSFVTYNSAGKSDPFSTSSGLGGGVYSQYGQIRMQSHPAGSAAFESYIQNNSANEGGGIFAEGPNQASGGAYTFMRIVDAQFTDNTAKDKGGAVYSSNAVDWRFDNSGGPCMSFFLGAVACSYVGGNQAQGLASATAVANGAAAYLTDDRSDGASRGIIRFLRTEFSGNADANGLAAIAATGSAGEMLFERDVFINNSAETGTALNVPSALVYSDNGKNVYFRYNTVLVNNVTRMFSMSGGTLFAEGSILWGSANASMAGHYIGFFSGGATYSDVGCALLRDSTYLPVSPSGDWIGYAPQLDSLFAPGGSSPAVDNCDSYDYAPIADIYGRSVYDVPGVPARYKDAAPYNFDLGAVEQTDIIFANSFGTRPDN